MFKKVSNTKSYYLSKVLNKKIDYNKIPKNLLNDTDITLAIISTYSDNMKNNEIGNFCRLIHNCCNKRNKEIALAAVRKLGFVLSYLNSTFKNDFDVVCNAVNQDSLSLQYASVSLKDNKEIVKLAVNKNGRALQHASIFLKENYNIAELAVKNDGRALKYVGSQLKENKEVVLHAVKDNGKNIKFAGFFLKKDEQIALLAIKQNSMAFPYISEELKMCLDFVLQAMALQGNVVTFLQEHIRLKSVDYVTEKFTIHTQLLTFLAGERPQVDPITTTTFVLPIANVCSNDIKHHISDFLGCVYSKKLEIVQKAYHNIQPFL